MTRRRAHPAGKRLARLVVDVLEAAFGELVQTGGTRPSKLHRDAALRLLGYDPGTVVGLFVVVDGAS
jgi:hypothetical protein